MTAGVVGGHRRAAGASTTKTRAAGAAGAAESARKGQIGAWDESSDWRRLRYFTSPTARLSRRSAGITQEEALRTALGATAQTTRAPRNKSRPRSRPWRRREPNGIPRWT